MIKKLQSLFVKTRKWFLQPRTDALLRALISKRRVLILGSGPSVHDLSTVPEDVLVFSCNMGPHVLLEKHFPPKVDLYLGNEKAFKNYGDPLYSLTEQLDISFLLTRNPDFIKKHSEKFHYEKLIRERVTSETYYLKKLYTDTSVIFDTKDSRTSTGIGLLQYALFYGAKEIYLSGIDLNIEEAGHAFVSPTEKRYNEPHKSADEQFVTWAAQNFSKIFIASEKSPLTKLFPYKKLI